MPETILEAAFILSILALTGLVMIELHRVRELPRSTRIFARVFGLAIVGMGVVGFILHTT